MTNLLRVAIIGCGRRATAWTHNFGLIPEVELVAVCDRIEPRAREIADTVKGPYPAVYTDHARMLKEVDCAAVAVATEPYYQADLCVAAMEAGKDVISEVPVAYDIDACWRLVLAAERTGRTYYLAEQIRHGPMARAWQKTVRDGRIGTPLFAEGHYIHAMAGDRFWHDGKTGTQLTWQQAAMNPNAVKSRSFRRTHPIWYGPHELSPLLKVLDDRVARVSCLGTRVPSNRFEEVPLPGQNENIPIADLEVALMHTVKGTIIRFAAGFHPPVSKAHWYHILGTQGEVETGRGHGEPDKKYFFPGPVIGTTDNCIAREDADWEAEIGSGDKIAAQSGHGGLDYYPVKNFVDVLLKGATPDIDVYQAVETAAPVIFAGLSAERNGEMLEIPNFRPGPDRAAGQAPQAQR